MNSKGPPAEDEGFTPTPTHQLLEGRQPEPEIEIEKFQLKRQLGVLYGVAIIMGLIIGSGIYISPQTVLRNAGSPGLTLVMWFSGGVYALLGALVFAEIGIQVPIAGEKYAYLSELYSPYFGFLYIWQYLLLVRPGSNALKLIIFGRYLLKPLFQNCEVPRIPVLCLASVMAFLISALNCLNIKVAARGQSIMTSISVMTLSTLALLGLYSLGTGHVENLQEPFKESCLEPGCLVSAFYATVFSYHGWSALNFLVEELKNPNRTLPMAIVLSSVLLTILYVMVNLTYLIVLDKNEAIASEAIAISVAMKISIFGGWVMSILIALTAFSSSNSGLLITSRLAYAGARKGDLPIVLSFINITFVTPSVAVIFMGLGITLFIWIFEVEFILNNITFGGIVCDLLVAIGYLKKRWMSRHIKNDKLTMPIVIHVVYCLVLILLTIVPLITNPMASTAAFLVVISSASFYYVTIIKLRLGHKWMASTSSRLTTLVQKLLYCAPAEKID